MKSEAVSLPVIAGVPLDCSFWPEDDGWSGVCERLLVIVRGCTFEDAKKRPPGTHRAYLARAVGARCPAGFLASLVRPGLLSCCYA
jgi:hypothetical protein